MWKAKYPNVMTAAVRWINAGSFFTPPRNPANADVHGNPENFSIMPVSASDKKLMITNTCV